MKHQTGDSNEVPSSMASATFCTPAPTRPQPESTSNASVDPIIHPKKNEQNASLGEIGLKACVFASKVMKYCNENVKFWFAEGPTA